MESSMHLSQDAFSYFICSSIQWFGSIGALFSSNSWSNIDKLIKGEGSNLSKLLSRTSNFYKFVLGQSKRSHTWTNFYWDGGYDSLSDRKLIPILISQLQLLGNLLLNTFLIMHVLLFKFGSLPLLKLPDFCVIFKIWLVTNTIIF